MIRACQVCRGPVQVIARLGSDVCSGDCQTILDHASDLWQYTLTDERPLDERRERIRWLVEHRRTGGTLPEPASAVRRGDAENAEALRRWPVES